MTSVVVLNVLAKKGILHIVNEQFQIYKTKQCYLVQVLNNRMHHVAWIFNFSRGKKVLNMAQWI